MGALEALEAWARHSEAGYRGNGGVGADAPHFILSLRVGRDGGWGRAYVNVAHPGVPGPRKPPASAKTA